MSKVSIIVPAYNAEQYLRECLDSIICQTLEDIQIICVNDGSKDGTLAIMQEYAARDSRILVVDKPNTGYGHSMNVGMSQASGEYIGIVESDDYVLPDMYKTLYDLAQKHCVDIVKSDFYRFTHVDGAVDKKYARLSKNPSYYNRVINPLDPAERLIFRFPINTWTGIYKRSFLVENNIRHNETPGASYQDNGFWFQTFCKATRVYFINQAFYMNRRDNPGSSVYDKGKVYCMKDEYDYIRNFLEENPELKESFLGVHYMKRFNNYIFTYNRIALEHKLMFLRHISEEFSDAQKKGELHEEDFTASEWKTLQSIITDADKCYKEWIADEVYRTRTQSNAVSDKKKVPDIFEVMNASRIYKVGLIVTYIPRKVRDIYRYIIGKIRKRVGHNNTLE